MKWKRLTIKTTTEAEDIIIAELYDLGLEGAMIEDNIPLTALEKEQMFVDILPETKIDDGIAYLSFFVEVPDENVSNDATQIDVDAEDVDSSYFMISNGEPVDIDKLVTLVEAKLEEIKCFLEIGEGTVTVSETEDKDWLNNWKQFFHQFYIDDLLVIPSWEEVKKEDEDRMRLRIDPGTAFGTGMHETTQLCIRQLKKYITKDSELLDVGTGSGILAIVSLMYGLKSAVGTDLDPCAVAAVEENMEMNHMDADKFKLMIGNIISDQEIQDEVGYQKYDIVVANILAEVLVLLTPQVVKHLKPQGIYITSGIILEKVDLVKETMEKAGFKVLEVTKQNEWASVTAQLQ